MEKNRHTNKDMYTICNKRFNQKGENLCCFCSPHSHCEFKNIVKDYGTATEYNLSSIEEHNHLTCKDPKCEWHGEELKTIPR